MKVTPQALEELEKLAGGADEGGPVSLTLPHLQRILDIQGYYAGISLRFTPKTGKDGAYVGWRCEPR